MRTTYGMGWIAELTSRSAGLEDTYVDDCQLVDIVADHVKDKDVAERLWRVAEDITGGGY